MIESSIIGNMFENGIYSRRQKSTFYSASKSITNGQKLSMQEFRTHRYAISPFESLTFGIDGFIISIGTDISWNNSNPSIPHFVDTEGNVIEKPVYKLRWKMKLFPYLEKHIVSKINPFSMYSYQEFFNHKDFAIWTETELVYGIGDWLSKFDFIELFRRKQLLKLLEKVQNEYPEEFI